LKCAPKGSGCFCCFKVTRETVSKQGRLLQVDAAVEVPQTTEDSVDDAEVGALLELATDDIDIAPVQVVNTPMVCNCGVPPWAFSTMEDEDGKEGCKNGCLRNWDKGGVLFGAPKPDLVKCLHQGSGCYCCSKVVTTAPKDGASELKQVKKQEAKETFQESKAEL